MSRDVPPAPERAVGRIACPTWPMPRRLLPEIQWDTPAQPPLPTQPEPPAAARPGNVTPEQFREASIITSAVIEALAGVRPLTQLERYCTSTLLLLMGHLVRSRAGDGLRLRDIDVQSPSPDVLEVTALLSLGPIGRVAALKIVKGKAHWGCTHLEIAFTNTSITRCH